MLLVNPTVEVTMKRNYRKSTIKDVALKAGVSPTTVSHFVSGRSGTCSPETAERIREAIDHLHYSPSSQGRALRLNATHTIGICTHSIYELPDYDTDGIRYVERFMRGVASEAGKNEYALLYYPPNIRQGADYRPFLDGRVDGILFFARKEDPRPSAIMKAGLCAVLVGSDVPEDSVCDAVYAEESDTVSLAMSHLWERGHRRIAHIAGPQNPWSEIARQRHDYYVSFMIQRGLYDPLLVASEDSWEPTAPIRSVGYWKTMHAPPTAVFCANDAIARNFVRTAQAIDWRVPEDVAVVGVDNAPSSHLYHPFLTTVDVPLEKFGAEAVKALLRRMNQDDAEENNPPARIVVPVRELITRETT